MQLIVVFFSRTRQFVEKYPLVLLFCIFILTGLAGSWINYPLSGSFKLQEMTDSWWNQWVGLLIGLILVSHCLVVEQKKYFAQFFSSLALFLIVLHLGLWNSFNNVDNLHQYIMESQEFRNIQHVLMQNEVPNAGRSLESSLAFDFYHFSERLSASFAILGWGAKFSILFSLLLFVRALVVFPKLLNGLLYGSFGLLFYIVISSIGNSLFSYYLLNQGVESLNKNNTFSAMENFIQAGKIDPVLAGSQGYSLILSYAYYLRFGFDDVNARAYVLNQYYETGAFDQVIAFANLQDQRIQDLYVTGFAAESINQEISNQSRFTLSRSYIRLGFRRYIKQQWSDSEDYFINSVKTDGSLVSKVALMSIYARTNRYDDCVIVADGLLDKIRNASFSADIWSTRGDCLSLQGDIIGARNSYEKSLEIDNVKNFRAVKGLSGT